MFATTVFYPVMRRPLILKNYFVKELWNKESLSEIHTSELSNIRYPKTNRCSSFEAILKL